MIKTLLTLAMMTSSALAVNLAIKLELTENAKKVINSILDKGTLDETTKKKLVKTPHITIGYIENIDSEKTAKKIFNSAKNFLEKELEENSFDYYVEEMAIKFDSHTVLAPTKNTEKNLKKLNGKLEEYVNNLGYKFNKFTTNDNYTPHITLINGTVGPNRLKSMNKEIDKIKEKKNGNLFFKIDSIGSGIKK